MGQLKEKKIVQSRNWLDPNAAPIPPYDYDFIFPITVYEAVRKTMDDSSSNLLEELESIYRLIAEKQNIIQAGLPGNLMSWSGVKGEIGSTEVTKSIHPDASQRSHSKIPTERAIGDALDFRAPMSALNNHIQDGSIHTSDIERTRWNSMTPLTTTQAHIANSTLHVTNEERVRWNASAKQIELDNHIYNTNNPHNVTASQVGAYTRREIDDMFANLRETFFNYLNIVYDPYSGKDPVLGDYHPANWNPNYVLPWADNKSNSFPAVPDPSSIYFGLVPASDYTVAESDIVEIWIKRPGQIWGMVATHKMKAGDMVIQYPDTLMYVWLQGRFIRLFSNNAGGDSGGTGDGPLNGMVWRPSIVDGVVSWTLSNEVEPPTSTIVKGADGYTPLKGVDYDDGKDGAGVVIGGVTGDILVKLSNDNYDTTWKSFSDLFADIVTAGGLPENVVNWESIQGRPEWFSTPGNSEDGFMTQWAVTRQFDIVNSKINDITGSIEGPGGLIGTYQTLYDHINDFNNPHRVTPAIIGAVSIAAFNNHVQNFNNPHNVTAEQLGLDNVDNTADIDKPVSIAVQTVLDDLKNKMNVVINDIGSMNYVTTVNWNNAQGNLLFTFRNGSTLNVAIPIKDIFNGITVDNLSKELVIPLPDGTTHRVDISCLIQTYYGSTGNHINVIVENDNIIKADIIPSSITEFEIMQSVHLRGNPTTTTQSVSDRSTRIATTEHVKSVVINNLISYEVDRPLSANMGRILNEKKADVDDVIQIITDLEGVSVIDHLESANPEAALSANMGRHLDLTKAPRVHTSPSGSTYGMANISLFGHVRASEVDPEMDGAVFRGTDDGRYARADHRHPNDTSRATKIEFDEHVATRIAAISPAETAPGNHSFRVAAGNVIQRKIGEPDEWADIPLAARSIGIDAVITEKIMDQNVTTDKIADRNITTEKVNNRAITGNELFTSSINNRVLTVSNGPSTDPSWTQVNGNMIVDNVALAGNPTTTTQPVTDNSNRLATTSFVKESLDADEVFESGQAGDIISEFMGFTTERGGTVNNYGEVSKILVSIPFKNIKTNNQPLVTISAGPWKAYFGGSVGNPVLNGTYTIPLVSPTIVCKTKSHATVEFSFDGTAPNTAPYPSNSPCFLVYGGTAAKITVSSTT